MSETEDPRQQESRREEATPAQPLFRAEELFRGHREIWIEHDGKRYRLRLTRRNKLILQK